MGNRRWSCLGPRCLPWRVGLHSEVPTTGMMQYNKFAVEAGTSNTNRHWSHQLVRTHAAANVLSHATGLPTLTSVASDPLNIDAIRLDNELSAWAAMCSSRSVTEVTTKASGLHIPWKMANFHGVYLKFGCMDSSEFFLWYSKKCFSYCHKILKWYEPVLC